MNFQSPPDRNMTDKLLNSASMMEMKLLNSCRSEDRFHQLQSQISITELDRIQRAKREEAEKLNAELHFCSMIDKWRNDDKIQGLPFFGCTDDRENMDSTDCNNNNCIASRSMQYQGSGNSNQTHNDDIDGIDDNVNVAFDQDNALMPRNRFTPKQTPTNTFPAPKLLFRPRQNLFPRKEEAVIILASKIEGIEDTFEDLFPSPHSNKFVLQVPNAPTEEVTLCTLVEDEDGDDVDCDIEQALEYQYIDCHFKQANEEPQRCFVSGPSDLKTGGPSISSVGSYLRPLGSNTSLPLHQQHMHTFPTLGNSGNCSSPNPNKRERHQKKKVLLKPKKRRSYSHVEVNVSGNSGLTSVSTLRGNANGLEQGLSEMSSDVDGNASASATAAHHLAPAFRTNMFLPINPKRLGTQSLADKYSTNECSDKVMEFGPSMSFSKELEISFGPKPDAAARHHDFTPKRHSCPNFSISNDCAPFSNSRTQSTNIMQVQIEMMKETDAKFVGSKRFMLPSDLSESDFSTPNAESVLNRNWLKSNHRGIAKD